MAKQLTAPGCKYSIVARVDTAIYSPDQTWTLDIPAGQTDFIAETNEIIIPADAMMCQKLQQTEEDLAKVNILGTGSGSLATFVTRAIEQIVGKGNAMVVYGDGKVIVALASSATDAQIVEVENMLGQVLPKDVAIEFDPLPTDYIRAEFLERTNTSAHAQSIVLPAWFNPAADTVRVETMHAGYRNGWLSAEGSYRDLGFAYGYYTNATALYMSGSKWGFSKTTSDIADLRYHTFSIESTPQVHSFFLDGEKYYEGNEDLSALDGFKFSLFEVHNDVRPFIGKKKYWNLDVNGKAVARLIPVLDAAGVPCMLNTVDRGVHYPETSVAFIAGFTLEQARKLGNLPERGGKLTASLPWEAQWDTEVQNALKTASTKGWTITVQYRDPDVATDNIPISFLESTGTQYITLPQGKQTVYAEMAADVQFTHLTNNTGMGFHYYTGGWWGVKNNKFFTEQAFADAVYSPLERCKINFTAEKSTGTQIKRNGEIIANNTQYKAVVNYSNCCLFGLYGNNMTSARIYNAQAFMGTDAAYDVVCAIDVQGVPCMYDKVRKQAFYNSGTGAFIAGFDTIEQARNLAYLPDVTAETDVTKKSLTVSLPWRAQLVSSIVPAALQVAANRGWTITVQYRDPDPEEELLLNTKYAECETVADLKAVNTAYSSDLTGDGAWKWKLQNLRDARQAFNNQAAVVRFEADLPNVTKAGKFLNHDWGGNSLKYVKAHCPQLVDAGQFCGYRKGLTEAYVTLPKASYLARAFASCQINKKSALMILDSLPSYASGSHLLTLGIHVDHQADEEVANAIAEAEAKRWTLTVQWNGTATAAVANTYAMRQPVYAKMVELLEDDTQHLDWGHYVTDWEQNGYLEFSSLEEAKEHFNINQTEEV